MADSLIKKRLKDKNSNGIKKEVITVIIAFIVVLTVSLIWLFADGNTLRIYLINDGSIQSESDVSVTIDDESFIKISDISVTDKYVCVSLNKLSDNKDGTNVHIKTPYIGQSHIVRTGVLGILHDRSTANFSSWQIFSLNGALYSLFAAFIFLKGYFGSKKRELFSYVTVTKLSVFLFFLFSGIAGVALLVKYFTDPLYFSFGSLLNALSETSFYFAAITAPLMAIFALLLCISNLALIRKEGFRPVNLLGIFISVIMAVILVGGLIIYELLGNPQIYQIKIILLNFYYGIYSFMECIMFAIFIIFFHISKHKPAYDKDCIVILGCAVKPDGTLYPLIKGRVDKAVEFAREQEEKTGHAPVFIPSGGKGDDEPLAEAQAMKNYLLSCGIPEDRIFAEDKSVNTLENMRFSKKIAESYKSNAKTAFSTTNYHVFRSGILANKTGWNIDGMGSKTKWYFWPNALIREFIGMIVDNRIGILIFALIILGFSIGFSFFI